MIVSSSVRGELDLLCLQLGHWTFILGSTEQADICILTHCRDEDGEKTVSIKQQHHQSRKHILTNISFHLLLLSSLVDGDKQQVELILLTGRVHH